MYLWSITRFNLYILNLLILLPLQQFVELPQYHHPDNILQNHHLHIDPPFYFGLSIFLYFQTLCRTPIKFFHFGEHRWRSLVLFHHHRYWNFQSTFWNWRPTLYSVLYWTVLYPLFSPLVDIHSLKSVGKIRRSPLDHDPPHHMLSVFFAKKRLLPQQTYRRYWHIQVSFRYFLLSLASKLTGTHETHPKHISFEMKCFDWYRLCKDS